ncbi:MAG: phosphoethanolamine transferase [Pseudomonadota bacterium]
MPLLLRPGTLYIVASYLLISALPFLPLAMGQAVTKPYHLLVMELVAWTLLWAACKRPRWFHYLLLPAFFAVPTEIYLRVYFGQGISTHHLGIIAETSPKEALEFLGNKAWLLLLVSIAVIAWWWSILRVAKHDQVLSWGHPTRWLAIAAYLVGLAIWIYGQQVGVASASASAKAASPATAATTAAAISAAPSSSSSAEDEDEEESDPPPASASAASAKKGSPATAYGSYLAKLLPHLPKLPHWAEIPYDDETFARTWPFGLVLRGADFWSERSYLSDLAGKSSTFSFKAYHAGQEALPQTIVMVIGESSRYDRWSLNGYQRETNPLLGKESNLVSFSDMVTSVSATRLSVPVMVSRKPATMSLKAGFSEKSFLTAFKEAGFKTYWLSNQMSFGQFDTPISVFAKEADVTQFLNLGGFTNSSNYDQILLEPLNNALHDPAPKKLIVLHTLGNHWNYSHRYPKSYDKWQPSLFGVENPAYTDLKNKQALNNSYDNSMLYIDWMLSEVINSLKSSQQLSAMLYVSDHGQTLYDGACNLAFHGHNTEYEFHVPAFVWYSDSYKNIHPDKVAQLYRHQKARLSTENIFHSLLDMANIRYPDERLQWSFLSEQFKPHTRYVDSYGWSNYDNATFKGDCREVIDRKKPLAQEK